MIHINIFLIIHVYHPALPDFLKIAHLFASNVAHNVNNVKDQQIFVLNVQIKIKNFLFQPVLAQTAVQQDNTLIKALEVALTVTKLVKFAKV